MRNKGIFPRFTGRLRKSVKPRAVLLFAAAYTFVLYVPPAIVAVALLYYVAARRKKWKEAGGLSPVKVALIELATAAYIVATAALVIPPAYYATLMNRYVMAPILAAAVIRYVVSGVRKGEWIPVPLHVLAAISFPAWVVTFLPALNTDAANERILRQRDYVTPIVMSRKYSRELGLPYKGVSPGNLRRMVSSPDEKYLYVTVSGVMKGEGGVLRVAADDLRKLRFLKLPGCHNLAVNRAGSIVYATGYFVGDIFKIKTPEMRLLRRIHGTDDLLQDIVLYEDDGYALVGGEMEAKIYRVNLAAGRVVGESRMPFPIMVDVLKRNAATGATYSRGDLMPSGFGEVDEKTGRLKRWKQFPMGMGFDFSPGGKTVFLNDSWFGYVYEMDLGDFRALRRFRVRPGLRGIAVDARRGLLYAGNYPDGMLDIVDMKSGRRLSSLYFGKKVRCVYLTPRRGRLFVISSYGLFEVNVDRALRAAGKSVFIR